MNKNVQILTIEGKDLLTRRYKFNKHSICKGSLDDSIEIDELNRISKKIIKLNDKKKRYYSNDIITVTFDYACKGDRDLTDEEYERVNSLQITLNMLEHKECKNNESKKLNKKNIKDTEKLLKIAKRNINKKEIRYQLYRYGFNLTINGKNNKYVRYKRSGGSARVGKCLFINEKYYKKMIDWSFAGINHKENTEMDCSSMETYISLSSSSCIGRIKLKPENILLVEDGESTFKDTVMATRLINTVKDKKGNIISGDLDTNIEEAEITNKIWDGESLLDTSVFKENGYEDKAILQIRNRFFKGIGVNTNIQSFFKDNNITDISQLNGKTIAKDIKDIKLITTPSSIKYLKYGTFEKWLTKIVPLWGVCKYEKPQHHFNGMVQTHYQLINTLGMDKEETEKFLQDSIDYVNYLKNNTTVFKYHLGLLKNEEEDYELRNISNNAEFTLNVLQRNDDFVKTKMGSEFKRNLIKSYIKNMRKGHILVNGNYSVVISCAYELLLHSINKWDGKYSLLKPFECSCSKFENGKEILGVRSPQPTMSNMCVFKNTKKDELDRYFNTKSEQVIHISSIGNNVFELQSSMDVDGDQMEVTDNEYIVKAYKRLQDYIFVNGKRIKRFLVPTDFTPKSSINRRYNWKDLADVDIKCSENKIGEIINLAQMLNSIYWDKKRKGASEEELLELYKDICQLDILSCIEIDRCKKLSPVNAKKELDKIRNKEYFKTSYITRNNQKKKVKVRPYFFKFLDGGKDYKFKKYECGMDYLEEVIDEKLKRKELDEIIPFSDIIDTNNCNNITSNTKMKVDKIKNKVVKLKNKQTIIWSDNNINNSNKYLLSKNEYLQTLEEIKKINVDDSVIYLILLRIGKSYDDNSRNNNYKYIGKKILNILYDCDKNMFLKKLKIKQNSNYNLIENDDGDIILYQKKFKKVPKTLTENF